MENTNYSNIDEKVAGNALSAYFLVFISWLFLFNKTNKYINNEFVKAHVLSSGIIHLLFVIIYIIFIHFSLFSGINFYGFGLNHIIAQGLFLGLFLLLIVGMYKAHNKKLFFAIDVISIIKKDKLIDINNDNTFDEKDKLTIILAYIPFLGFYNYSKYKTNSLIKNITKLNLIVSLILLLLYINLHYNLSNLILLFYSIYVVFIGINLFIQDNIININLSKFPTQNKLNILIKSTLIYLKNYFKENSKFKNFGDILNEKTKNYKLEEKKEIEELQKLKNTKLPKFLIYIPFVNLIFLFSRKTTQKNHIANGLTITLLLSIVLTLDFLNYYNTNIYIIFTIPIIYGFGYLQTKLTYKMPFIYEIYEFLKKIIGIFLFRSKEINKIRKKDEEVNLKVKK